MISSIGYTQNVTSPYSVLGIGDIDTKDYGRYFATSSTAIARRDMNAYNFSNPASLSALPYKNMNFDINFRGRNATFKTSTAVAATDQTKDFTIKRIAMAFKVTNKTAIAFGLRPYSSSNFLYYNTEKVLDGNTTYTKYVDGDGGVNQIYFSIGKEIKKGISVGLTTGWMFGSLKRITTYYGDNIDLYVNKDETATYYGASATAGIQVYTTKVKKWQHRIGAIVSMTNNLKGELTGDYYDENDAILKSAAVEQINFKMPITAAIGYSATLNKSLTLSVDGTYNKWKKQNVNYSNSYTNDAIRLSAGIEYARIVNKGDFSYEKYYLGAGIGVENSYLRIKSQKLWDNTFSLGGGYNVSRYLFLNFGYEFGWKGNNNIGQIKEQYTQYNIGITVKDLWFGTKKFGRFN